MKKIISLIKACMTDNMQLFKVKNKSNKKISKIMLPIILGLCCMFSVWSYANMFMEPLIKIHAEYILLSLFVIISFFFTLIEGIYKASGLLFNSRDDDLLLSLPIKRSTVLFVRIFKFYIFELLFNSIFLLPAIVVYIRYVKVEFSFYISSLFVLLLLPIIPIIISCILGSFISKISSKFKFKNLVQIVTTVILLLVIFYFSFNTQGLINNFGEKAAAINKVINKIYYPCNAYVKMATNFKIKDLLLFIFINTFLFVFTILGLSRFYFKINSGIKGVKTSISKGKYIIKKNKPIISLIKKELKKFIGSPVFITNTGFGLVLFVIGIVYITINFDKVATSISLESNLSLNEIKSYIPIILYGFICFTSFMTSITSSMISLEGKSFSILKSLPIKPITIILSKVLMAILVMIPLILIGDIILFIKFNFNILEILLIIIGTILLPLVSETIGIIINLKYPKMDAENDTEVVKQSMSSMIAVFIGMAVAALSVFGLVCGIKIGLDNTLLLSISNLIFGIIFIILFMYMKKKSVKLFNEINV